VVEQTRRPKFITERNGRLLKEESRESPLRRFFARGVVSVALTWAVPKDRELGGLGAGDHLDGKIAVTNLTDKVALYNFLSSFSGPTLLRQDRCKPSSGFGCKQ
jgi:hypothetical protein